MVSIEPKLQLRLLSCQVRTATSVLRLTFATNDLESWCVLSNDFSNSINDIGMSESCILPSVWKSTSFSLLELLELSRKELPMQLSEIKAFSH